MLLDAIFDKGEIKLVKPIQFAHERFAVQVQIPDDEIANPPRGEPAAAAISGTDWNGTAAEFKQLLEAAFDQNYRYIADKPDREILTDVLIERHG